MAMKVFFLSALCVIALTLEYNLDTSKASHLQHHLWDVLGALEAIGILFLWLGMWRYWTRVDDSNRSAKRLWFIVLLIGFWWGSALYYFLAYLPQTIRRKGLTHEAAYVWKASHRRLDRILELDPSVGYLPKTVCANSPHTTFQTFHDHSCVRFVHIRNHLALPPRYEACQKDGWPRRNEVRRIWVPCPRFWRAGLLTSPDHLV